MDGILFEEWVRELDRKFLSVGKSVSLVIDNCPAHHHMENLKSIKLFFLPPNTNSINNTANGSRCNKKLRIVRVWSKDHQKFRGKQCPARSFDFKSNANVGSRLECSIHQNYCKLFS